MIGFSATEGSLNIELSTAEVAPAEVGLSSTRLSHLDRHLHEYVDEGRIPGVVSLVARRGRIAHLDTYGSMDLEAGKPMQADTIFRIYSMTKPIVSVALMMLYEEGRVRLEQPAADFIPEFADLQVFVGGTAERPELEPPHRAMTVRDVLTHTSGLIYAFDNPSPVAELYEAAGLGRLDRPETLRAAIEALSRVPLASHPGENWIYGVSTDVVGHLVEVISGQTLDVFLAERVFEPLGMVDTGFFVPAEKLDRLAANYEPAEGGGLKLLDAPQTSRFASPPTFLSGGAGLVSTAADYLSFCQALVDDGAGLGEPRLLGRKTVELMTSNHLPGDIASIATHGWALDYHGEGFGLGFAVALDPAKMQKAGSVGQYNWGGAATTIFWIDPAEELIVLVLTQLMPSISEALRSELMALVYPALLD
jgi:CubicO group peptidase (beta-lactamase class C family)